ncbi:MAG TPA: hypothetical protein VHP55_01355 [Usitatibacter sp.]|jgi:SAM-dependent methyltransferase|nr:hypothetical protein [Usitatibacter sp.]
MAIEALYLQYLKRAIERTRGAQGRRLQGLLLAYPDLLVSRATLGRILGEEVLEGAIERADAAETWKFHVGTVADPMFDSIDILSRLGVDSTVIDVARLRGVERIVDLNEPLPADLRGRFDLVVDTGTCEHCFNVAQAFVNACEALAAGGILVHAAPLTRMNHGFWNFSPTLYPDFFGDNGFELQLLTGVEGTVKDGFRTFAVEAFRRFEAPADAALYVIARRNEVREIRWPVQRKYRGVIS